MVEYDGVKHNIMGNVSWTLIVNETRLEKKILSVKKKRKLGMSF